MDACERTDVSGEALRRGSGVSGADVGGLTLVDPDDTCPVFSKHPVKEFIFIMKC